MHQNRVLSVYEKNQLLKHGFKEDDLLTNGDLPVEYLTGFVEFKNLAVRVNKNVLIPRVESEELVDLMVVFSLLLKKELSYLEIGTGSGAISLAFYDFLMKKKDLGIKKFTVSDLSFPALKLAKENFKNLLGQVTTNQIEFLQSDLLENFVDQKFNLIVANLPYIPSREIENLDQSVKDHEPLLALDGGQTGFDLINKFLEQILEKDALDDNGKIFLEVYETHNSDFISKNFPNLHKFFLIEEFKDQFNRHRFLVFKKI